MKNLKRKLLIDIQYALKLNKIMTIEAIEKLVLPLFTILSIIGLYTMLFAEHDEFTTFGAIFFSFMVLLFTNATFRKV